MRGGGFKTCFPGGPAVKNLPEMQEMWVQSQGQEDPLEKEIATHSSILAWRSPWTEEPGATSHGVTKSWTRLSNLTCLLIEKLHSVKMSVTHDFFLAVACAAEARPPTRDGNFGLRSGSADS